MPCVWTGGVEHIATNGVIGYKADGRLSHFSGLQFPSPPLPAAVAGAAEAGGTSSSELPPGEQCADPPAVAVGAAAASVGGENLTAATVTLRAGEALYLPAGWAHQVTSEAAGATAAASSVGESASPPPSSSLDAVDDVVSLHAAINVWFPAPEDSNRRDGGDEL
eukprot:COSAG06_NODE_3018_length_5954_cov_3.513744_5_plen_165_part_00